ncbi:MAG: YbhB/YbcL family Raf kinase inhibitor-like protein [Hydrogenothermaceae bacterium]
MKKVLFLIFLIFSAVEVMAMEVEIPVFKNGEIIPKIYTCEGEDVSPPIRWSNFPKEAKSFVIIMEDPDAPMGVFTHWIVYDIPTNINSLLENFPKKPQVEEIKQGINDFGKIGYGGPCPPKGHGYHRYYFKIYALNIEKIGLPAGAKRRDLLNRIRSHIIAEGEVVGRYKRD